ncbi:sufE-like protein 2, chloroplastic [Tripterygium wilfordii]|uniref:sufE-like protein 2, chloroplastic n=1 Tax=Tripterygium wilfordii TaxID=458696 RepID=UPI0018F863C9|nr:sufE-like protein 2, chloroplastic [Tripterygium wilfordii]XP_038713355.1 sufE-like protein 2, chloroplastic [Tripterygium wilfordii]
MNSSSTLLTNISFSCFARQFQECSPNRGQFQLRLKKKSKAISSFKCIQISDWVLPKRFNLPEPSLSVSRAAMTCKVVDEKLKRLVLEFESLTQSIDRVKRLLHYAGRLPPFDESARVEANRVTGCTTQVWLEARLDESGRVRFCADSDSEITKGFISCLIWILDGAEPEEVLMVKKEDLGAMNVGLHGKAQSRVNTWHNVLISMQKRTMTLVAQSQIEPFPSLVVIADDIGADGRFNEDDVEMQESRWQKLDANLSRS